MVVVPRIQRSRWLEAVARWVSVARQEGFLPLASLARTPLSWAIRRAHRMAPVVKRHAPMAAIVT